MRLSTRVQGRSHRFRSVRDVLARAGAPKAGDASAGVGARSHLERAAATLVLAELTLADLRAHPATAAAGDEVTRAIDAGVHEAVYHEIRTRTVGELRDWMLETPARTPSRACRLTLAYCKAMLPSRWSSVESKARLRRRPCPLRVQ
jgi:ethanolamine ammonia-lyase large subunit